MTYDSHTDGSRQAHVKYCCLVVEDNSFAMDIMKTFLQQQGLDVETAENGKAAIDIYLENPDRYSIIFMDLQMPVMSGYEAAERIRSSGCPHAEETPIIAMSGEPLNNLNQLGFTAQLHKPFKMQSLIPLLAEQLGE